MKDPAFLFYSSDFLSGTMLMTDEEIGQYIKLICLQHQKGHLKEKDILNICKTHNEEIFSKFKIDEEGNYYDSGLYDSSGDYDTSGSYSDGTYDDGSYYDSGYDYSGTEGY